MSVTITLGKSGRLVVPKAIRESLGLHEGSRLTVEVHGGRIEAVPQPDAVSIVVKKGFPVIRGGRKLAAGEIVDIIKADRETRDGRVAPQSRKQGK